MKVDHEEISRILYLEDESSSGESCKFIDLENGWGIKCFFCKHDCEVSYLTQKEAAKYDLAPHVGKKFELTDHNGDGWYCHLTETADAVVGYGYQNSQVEYFDEYDEPPQYYLRDERDDYCCEFYDVLDTPYMDDHLGNFGWIRRNDKLKLVAIDFNLCYKLYNKIKGTP
jgi:hypothetical protein